MHNYKKDKEIMNSLKTARGQLDGIIRMIEDDRYCIDISKQIFAVQSLMRKANIQILRNHIDSCVMSAVNEGQGADKVDEIVHILAKYIDKA